MSTYRSDVEGAGSRRTRRTAAMAAMKGAEPVTGFMLTSSLSMDFVQFLQPAPDFIIIEQEHSHFALPEVAASIRMLNLLDVLSIVRIPEIRYEAISKALDAGADGILVPRIRSLEELVEVERGMRLAPTGTKGIGGYDFQGGNLVAKLENYRRDKILLIQIETAEALGEVEAFASSSDVDGLIIGPFDLSHSLGMAGDFDSTVFRDAVDRVIRASADAGIAVGAMMPTAAHAVDWRHRGMTISWIGTEVSIFTAGYAQLRSECGL